jgi:ABC-2 type transport system permease protein
VDGGLQDLRSDKLAGLYVVAAEYLETGQVEVYVMESSLEDTPGITVVQNLLRLSVLKKHVPADVREDQKLVGTINRLLTRVEPKRLTISDKGTVVPIGSALGAELAPLAVALLFVFSILISSGYLLQSTAEEKGNRVIEIVLSSVKPGELLWGKILGLGVAALMQLAVYVLVVVVIASYFFPMITVTVERVGWCVAYSVLGYLLFAGLLTATGVMGGNLRESLQLAGKWTMIAMSPVYFWSIILRAPNGTISRVLSFIPVTSPVTMILRLTTTASPVPLADVVISLAVLAVSAYLAVRAAAKVFRIGSLMYGKRIRLAELVRWVRET